MLLQVILQDTGDCLLECARVYGNLSRHPNVRKLLHETKGSCTLLCYMCTHNRALLSDALHLLLAVDEIMTTLLDSERMELVYASCGVLINMMADAHHRATLARMGGVRK